MELGEHLFTISFGALAIRPTCHYFVSSLSLISFGYLSVALKATNGLGKKVTTKMLTLLKPFKQLGIVPDLSNSLSQ